MHSRVVMLTKMSKCFWNLRDGSNISHSFQFLDYAETTEWIKRLEKRFNEKEPEILDSIRTSQLIDLLIGQYDRLAQPLPKSFLFYTFSIWPKWQVQSPPDPREALNFAASAIWVIVQARFPSRQHPLEVTLLLLHPFLLEEALHLPQLLPLHLAEALPQLLPLQPLLRLQERVLCRIVQTPPGLGSRCPLRRQVDLGFGV